MKFFKSEKNHFLKKINFKAFSGLILIRISIIEIFISISILANLFLPTVIISATDREN